MKDKITHLWLIVALILAASLLLLLSDLGNRKPRLTVNQAWKTEVESADSLLAGEADFFPDIRSKYGRPARVALITLVENKLLEEAENGVEAGLAWSGLIKGTDYTLQKFSAQGEIGQLPQIIDAAVATKPDLIISVTTPALVAVVSRVTDIPHVFTVASNPEKLSLFKSGRPGNICGLYDNPPLDALLDMAREYDAGITSVGILYDAAQANSIISVEKLRAAGKQKNVRVLEATASTLSELPMATQSLIQRGAKAIIISTDNLATTGFSSIYKVTRSAGIPIFVTEPQLVEQGAIGAIGISFFEWGKGSGKLAAKVLAGVPPSQLPITETEVLERVEPVRQSGGKPTRAYKISLVHYSETAFAERCHEGLLDGITGAGLVKGRDYTLRVFNAQGDMSTLSSIMTTVKADRVDLLLVISTPALQAALRQAGSDTRIVFTGVGDAVKAGAGKSETDHLPNVTGVTTRSPFDDMARLVREAVPGIRNAGTLFTPAEINSVIYKDWLKEELEKNGIGLVAVPVTSSTDLVQAAADLCGRDIQVVCQIADNMTRPGIALINRKAAENNLPVFVFDSDVMKDGATVCLARDYYQAGLEAAEKAVRVLRGENPASIPISLTRSEARYYDPDLVKKYRLNLPASFLEQATAVTPEKKND